MKYSKMSADVPIVSKDFDSILMKTTWEVVPLYEMGPEYQRDMAIYWCNGY